MTDAQILEMGDYRASKAFSAIERLVLDYATAMSTTPVEVSDALFAALREHFDEAQVVELTGAIAWENYRARFNHALEIGAQGFSEGAVCMLPARAAAPAVDREDGREQAHERGAVEAKP